MTLRRIGTLGLSLSVVLVAHARAETPRREFTFSSDPGVVVLEVSKWGGLSSETHTASLYGDCRLRHKFEFKLETLSTSEVRLPLESCHELVRIAVDHGLVEFGRNAYKEMLREHDPSGWSTFDAGLITVEIHLEDYRVGGQPQEKTEAYVSIEDPRDHLGGPLSEVPQIKGIVALHDRIGQLLPDPNRSGDN